MEKNNYFSLVVQFDLKKNFPNNLVIGSSMNILEGNLAIRPSCASQHDRLIPLLRELHLAKKKTF